MMKEIGSEMNINYIANLPDNFPKELIDLAKTLEHLKISELAWDFENAIKVIDFLNQNNCAILGGDVYKIVDENLDSTYDSWYFNRNEAKSNQDFLHGSMIRAITYISKYHENNGNEYYYSIIFSKLK